MSDVGYCKCRYQVSDGCTNWTNEGLTFGTSGVWDGPADERGFSTLVQRPQPICAPCLAYLNDLERDDRRRDELDQLAQQHNRQLRKG
jgi:hypothetical protein